MPTNDISTGTGTDSDTDDDLYIRQDLLSLCIPEEASIVGCGGTGTWTGILCAMIGVKRIHLFDDDILENHNRSRLPYPQEWVGEKKTEVLKRFIHTIRPECMVMTYGGIYNDTHLVLLAGNIVFDCNDDFSIQKKIDQYCKNNNIRYIGVGCNADHVTVKEDISNIWSVEGSQPNRYQITAMFVAPPIISSLCAIWNIIKGQRNISVLNSISYMFTDAYRKTRVTRQCSICPLKEECEGCSTCNIDMHIPCNHCPVT